MPKQEAASIKTSRKAKWPLLLSGALLLLVSLGAILLAFKWPFSRQELVQSIQEIVPASKIEMASFRPNVFPNPGCDADNVTVRRLSDDPSLPPLVTVQRIRIQASYPDLFLRPGYIARIILSGLRVSVPHSRHGRNNDSSSTETVSSTTRVGEITANGALLEVGRAGDKPLLVFQIHSLSLKTVSRDKPFAFAVSLTNALPPGQIVSKGQMGPWNRTEWGKTPVSGRDHFQNADLFALPGIGGTLSSDDRFGGTLDQIRVNGAIDIPDFLMKMGGHSNAIHTRYSATVNATNGDVLLGNVDSTIAKTRIVASGKVAGHPGSNGKSTSLAVEVKKGRIQDILRLFVSAPTPPLAGDTNFQASIQVLPQGQPFLKELNLHGDFTIEGGRFTKAETQNSVNGLSRRARGDARANSYNQSGENVQTDMNGRVDVRNGIAHFTELVFRAPGAVARMDGNYDLMSEKIDLHGTLKTEAELSQTTGGVKSLLLKPFNRLFKRKHAGADLPIQMTGTYQNPHFGIQLNPVEALKK